MPLLEFTTGKENQQYRSAEVYAALIHQGQTILPYKAVKDHPRIICYVGGGYNAPTPATRNSPPSIGGQWFTNQAQVAEGSMLKIWTRVNRSGFGTLPKSGGMFIRCRELAAFRSVKIHLINNENSILPHVTFSGRFDIISPADVRAAHPGYQFDSTYGVEADRRELFEQAIISPEIENPVKIVVKEIQTESGEVIAYPQRQNRRALIMD